MVTCGPLEDQQHCEIESWHKSIIDNPNQSEDTITTAHEMYRILTTLTFTNTMRQYVQKVFDRVMDLVDLGYKAFPELRVSLKKYFGHSQCDGSVDIPMVKDGHLIIADLKYGVVEAVYPEENAQLCLYGLGACAAFERDYGITIDTVSIVICQPRVNDRVWDEWATTKSWLLEYAGKMKIASIKALSAIGDPESVTPEMYVPGEKSCTYCHRKMDCTSRKDMALASAIDAFSIGGETLNVDSEGVPATPDVLNVTDEDLAKIMNVAPFILSFLRDVEKETFARVHSGKDIDGRKLVKGRLSRSWAVKPTELATALKSFGLSDDDIYEKKLRSPAKFDNYDMPQHLRPILESMVKKGYGQPIVALKNDRREAIALVSAIDAFTES